MALMDFFRKKSSGDVAKDRLKLLLISDRANCSPEVMELIKNDIIKVISKYMEIDCENLDIQILTDVTNPLCGENGATYVFGGQKGLSALLFSQVDQAMATFYKQANPAIFSLAGAGAGGGMVTFAHGKIVSGIDTCLDLLDFDNRIKKADLVIVGEGRMDQQSLAGKAPIGVAKRTPSNIPVIAICGSLSEDLPPLPLENIVAAFSILEKSEPLAESLKKADVYLENTAASIARIMSLR